MDLPVTIRADNENAKRTILLLAPALPAGDPVNPKQGKRHIRPAQLAGTLYGYFYPLLLIRTDPYAGCFSHDKPHIFMINSGMINIPVPVRS